MAWKSELADGTSLFVTAGGGRAGFGVTALSQGFH
jgi:hypothetical protein